MAVFEGIADSARFHRCADRARECGGGGASWQLSEEEIDALKIEGGAE